MPDDAPRTAATPRPGEPDTPEEARTETAADVRALRKHDEPPPEPAPDA